MVSARADGGAPIHQEDVALRNTLMRSEQSPDVTTEVVEELLSALADHRVEFNHTQFIPPRIAPRELRDTITADGPKDLREMWLASGVDAHVPETPAVAVASAPVKPASTDAASAEPTGPE